MADEKETLDIHEAAKLLGVHEQTVRRLARKNDIPSYKVGRLWRFDRAALHRWAETHHERTRAANILVVDDEPGIRDFVRRVLELEGYGVSTASDGPEALALMQRQAPDVVLLDLKMPGMAGPTVLKKIRKAHGALPVIIITGYPDSDLMAEALRYAPVLMLPKPVEQDQVLEAVGVALHGRESSAR